MVQKSSDHQLRGTVDYLPLFFSRFSTSKRWLALGFLNHQQYYLNDPSMMFATPGSCTPWCGARVGPGKPGLAGPSPDLTPGGQPLVWRGGQRDGTMICICYICIQHTRITWHFLGGAFCISKSQFMWYDLEYDRRLHMSEDMIHIILCQPHFMVFPGFPDFAPPFLAAEIFDMFGGLAF